MVEQKENVDYPPQGVSKVVKKLEKWIQLGCGDAAYNCPEKNATFAVDGVTPDVMPDLSEHNNFMAEFLREHKEVYDTLKRKTTANGVTLAQCMKTGVDNKGHPHIKTVGLTAGDEESYEVFKELFDPVISARHGGYGTHQTQPTDLDLSKISDIDMDPDNKYIETTRVRTGRSMRGFRLPPTIGFEERRKLEKLLVKGLLNLSGDLKGDYFPLHGSHSYAPKANGMSEEKQARLRKMGNLFQDPVSMQRDANMKDTFARFVRACDELQKVLKAEGLDFMHNDRLGWLLTCPSNLGTGLRAGMLINLPNFSKRADFKEVLSVMRLQARGTAGVDSASTGGKWDISNADRIGKSEVELLNLVIEGAAQLIKWETLLEEGNIDDVDNQVAEKKPPHI